MVVICDHAAPPSSGVFCYRDGNDPVQANTADHAPRRMLQRGTANIGLKAFTLESVARRSLGSLRAENFAHSMFRLVHKLHQLSLYHHGGVHLLPLVH